MRRFAFVCLKIRSHKRLLNVNGSHVFPLTYKLALRGFVVDSAAADIASINARPLLHAVCVTNCRAQGRGAELSHTGNSKINFLWPPGPLQG